MRKFIIALIAMALAVPAFAGDFEISGHVNTGFGYAKTDTNYGVAGSGAANPNIAFRDGALAEFNGNSLTGGDHAFNFFVDEAEIDLEKEWGENFRARVDLSFGNALSGSTNTAGLEQAYTTVNLPFGNGAEFLVGRFDAPIGFESNERGENTLASHGTIWRSLRPTTMTGAKFYYPFSDMVDLHLYVVNSLRDNGINGLTAANAPSAGFRLGFGWGDYDQRSTFGLSFAGGQENDNGTFAQDLSWLVDADWNVWLGDSFAIGGEGLFRQDGSTGTKGTYFAGQLNLHYAFSDVWDGTLRYGYASDKATMAPGIGNLLNAAGGAGTKTQIHNIALGGQYHIADNAKLQVEFGYDMNKVATTAKTYGGVFNFAYNF